MFYETLFSDHKNIQRCPVVAEKKEHHETFKQCSVNKIELHAHRFTKMEFSFPTLTFHSL